MRRPRVTSHVHDAGLSPTRRRGKKLGECVPWWGLRAHVGVCDDPLRMVHDVNHSHQTDMLHDEKQRISYAQPRAQWYLVSFSDLSLGICFQATSAAECIWDVSAAGVSHGKNSGMSPLSTAYVWLSRAVGKNRAHKWTASSSSENTTRITRSNCVGCKRHDPNRRDYACLLSKKKNKTHLFGFVRV